MVGENTPHGEKTSGATVDAWTSSHDRADTLNKTFRAEVVVEAVKSHPLIQMPPTRSGNAIREQSGYCAEPLPMRFFRGSIPDLEHEPINKRVAQDSEMIALLAKRRDYGLGLVGIF